MSEKWENLMETLSPRQLDLIRRAYDIIAEKGVDTVSLQDIADTAGVSKALVLYYFKTRENLILATVRWVLLRVAQRIRAAVANADSPEQKIQAMIDAIFIQPEANRRFYLFYLDLMGYAIRHDRFNKLSTTFRSIVDDLYADVIRLGVEQGAFAVEDIEEAAATIRALIDGLFIQWLHESNWKERHDSYKRLCSRVILSYLKSS